jgi:hypothetical protein
LSIFVLFSKKNAVPMSEMNVIKVIKIGKSMLDRRRKHKPHSAMDERDVPEAHFLIPMMVVMALSSTGTQQKVLDSLFAYVNRREHQIHRLRKHEHRLYPPSARRSKGSDMTAGEPTCTYP